MQICQGRIIIQPLRHRELALQKIQTSVAFRREALQVVLDRHAFIVRRRFYYPAFGFTGSVRRRNKLKGQVIDTLKQVSLTRFFFKFTSAFLFDYPSCGVSKVRHRILTGRNTRRFKIKRPARPETAKRIIEARAGRNSFFLCRAFKIGAAKLRCALKAPVLIEHRAGRNERCPRQIIR